MNCYLCARKAPDFIGSGVLASQGRPDLTANHVAATPVRRTVLDPQRPDPIQGAA